MIDDDQDDLFSSRLFDWNEMRSAAHGRMRSAVRGRKVRTNHDQERPERAVKAPAQRVKTADLLAFPGERRLAFVRRQAERMASMPAERAEAYLRQHLAIQGDVMRRRGLQEARVQRVLRGLESSVRAELFRRVLVPSDGGNPA